MPFATALLVCIVIHVSDGDSLLAHCPESSSGVRTQPIRVRIADIDAPELTQDFGRTAKAALVHLCLGQTATIAPVALDRYERLVARVRCRSSDVVAAQVGAGLAWVYSRRAKADTHALLDLQGQAQALRLGLWSDAAPQTPWSYRRSHPSVHYGARTP